VILNLFWRGAKSALGGLAFFLFFLCCFLDYPLFASDIPVDLKADQLQYDENAGIISASGSVEVQFEDVTILADRMFLDPATNIATAEGHVRVYASDYSSLADALTYDASSEISSFKGYRVKIRPQKTYGDFFISAKQCVDYKDKMLGDHGSATSCEKSLPHYFLLADRVEYYPHESIIGRNATLFVGEMPVLWLPYFYYDLHEKRKREWNFGHNEVEGDFVKTTWNNRWGTLFLDVMTKKGMGYGGAMDYALAALGFGSLYFYHLSESDTGINDWITRFVYNKQLGNATDLKLDHRYTATYLIPSGRSDQTALTFYLGNNLTDKWSLNVSNLDDRMAFYKKYALQFNKSGQNLNASYNFNYEHSTRSPEWIRTSQHLYFQSPLGISKANLKMHVNFYNNIADKNAVGDERLEPDFEINGAEANFSWGLKGNWYFDPDENAYTADNGYQYLERKPEIQIKPKTLDLNWFNLDSSLSAGQYHEVRYVAELGRNRDFTANRGALSLNAGKSFPVGLGTIAYIGLGLDQFFYSPGDQLYAYRESGSLNTSLLGFFRNSLSYSKAATDGNTPFLFDQLGTRYHNLAESLTFYTDKMNWTTNGGYNWQTHKWLDVMSAFSLQPLSTMALRVSSGWDIENTRYKDLVSSLHLAPLSFFGVDVSFTSDINNGQLKYGNVLYDLYLLKAEPNQWRLKVSQVFDATDRQFKVRDIMIVKDLHCWELKYSYSDWRKEFSLTFTLKAVPDQPVGYASGKDLYFDGFDRELKKLLNEIKPEGGGVTRY
jgi:hypothetical protein